MQHLEVRCAVRRLFKSLGFKGLRAPTADKLASKEHRVFKYIQVSHELRSLLRESVPYVKIYRYNPKHLCPKLNGYGDNDQRKVLTSCISAYCTSSAVSALTLTEQCSRHLCECTSSAQHDKIVLHYCQIFMRYVQCLVTLRTTMK